MLLTINQTLICAMLSKLSIWLLAVRPKTLPASLSPVLVGGACAWAQGFCHLRVWALTVVTAMLLQIIANLANDFFDYKHAFDLPGRHGPLRIMQNDLVSPQIFFAVIVALSCAVVLPGLILVWHGGWPVLVLGVVSLAFAFLYSAGPWPLASHAMGEAATVFFFGLVAGGGAYYLQTGAINTTVLVLSLVPGLLTAGVMIINNYRDLELDRESGKTTLFVVLGAAWGRRFYAASVSVAYLIVVLAVVCAPEISSWALLALLSLPLGLKLIRDIYTKQGSVLNVTLAQTALLTFVTSLLLAAGLQI